MTFVLSTQYFSFLLYYTPSATIDTFLALKLFPIPLSSTLIFQYEKLMLDGKSRLFLTYTFL